MKSRLLFMIGIASLALPAATTKFAQSADPLPSWNTGPAKQAIVEFVRATTDAASPQFVPPAERIATFDQDGTLWVEQPLATQGIFCLDRVPALVAAKPALKDVEPFKTALSGDLAAIMKLPIPELEKLVMATHSGMTVEQFQTDVKTWLASTRDPRWHRPYTQLTYQPMQEVLHYLRDNGYITYIVTGGGEDFVRVFSEQTYGIPPEQVVGSRGGVTYGYDANGKPILTKEPTLILNDDHTGKVEGVHMSIGRRPYAAFGNTPGDQQMLEYTKTGDGARLAMLVLHDDATREYAYGPALGLPGVGLGAFPQAYYDLAIKNGWTVISMKNDWNRVFAFDGANTEQKTDENGTAMTPTQGRPVTAIDTLLEPDETMIEHATADNARLLQNFPKGYTLGGVHAPHISMLQRYVYTDELDKVYAAVDKVFAEEDPTSWKLKAFKYYYIPSGPIGLAGIVIEPTPDLLRLQQKLIDAEAPFVAPTGTATAYVTTPQDPDIVAPLIEYVRVFVPEHSGAHFSPHVTIGVGTIDFLNALLAEPFAPFTFSPVGASVYHLGNYGTAMVKLHAIPVKH